MKIALVHSYYSSRQSSGENVVVDAQAAALRGHGHDVRVVAQRTDELEGTPAYKFRSAIRVATGNGPSPVEYLHEFGPDIVHVHNLFPNWGTSWLDEWKGPLVATVHNFRPVCAAGTLYRDGAGCTLCPDSSVIHAVRNACYRDSTLATLPLAIRNRDGLAGDRLLSRADRIILLSTRSRELYASFGLMLSRVAVIPNFVSDEGFTPTLPSGNEWAYIGRLTEEKGIRNLLKHWPKDQLLRIYGDGPLREEVEAAAGDNITYVGQLDHHKIPNALAQARGLIFPSEWAEGLPLVYAEALASGRMVVAKAGNSAADDVSAHRTGQVFEEWAEIGDALDRAITHSHQLSLSAREQYESSFSRRVWLDRTLNLYESLLQETIQA